MQQSLIDQGLSLMLYGMGTVFVFLTVLVGATVIMSAVANRFAAPEAPAVEADTANSASQPPEEIKAAIAKAIALHRKG